MTDIAVFNEICTVAFNVIYFSVILTTIFVVILDNRNPVKTMAWILVLFFLPVIGLIFYFFFGRSTRKERLISRRGYTRLSKRPMAEYQQQTAIRELPDQSRLMSFFNRVNGALAFGGNDITVYTDGYAMLKGLLREISHAQKHIHIQLYF